MPSITEFGSQAQGSGIWLWLLSKSRFYSIVLCSAAIFFAHVSAASDVAGPVGVQSISLEQNSASNGTLIFSITDTFDGCVAAGTTMAFDYAIDTLAESYLSLLLAARVSGKAIFIEYEAVGSDCNLLALRIQR